MNCIIVTEDDTITFNNIKDARAEYNSLVANPKVFEVALWKLSDWLNNDDAFPIAEFIRE